MPSPIAHLTAGYVISRLFAKQQPDHLPARLVPLTYTLVAACSLSLLPDVDTVPAVFTGDLTRFHNNLTHSLAIGAIAAATIGAVVWYRRRAGFRYWCVLALVAYWMHLAMDFFTAGRGIMLFWPFTTERFSSPVLLFYGLHWSDGWLSERHVITIATEAAFAALVGSITWLVSNGCRPKQVTTVDTQRGGAPSTQVNRTGP